MSSLPSTPASPAGSGKNRQSTGQVTLRELSKITGFSVPTVSSVLNGNGGRHSEATKKKIQRAAAKAGYHPSRMAQAMRRRRTRMIGIVAHDDKFDTAIRLSQHVCKSLQAANYQPLRVDPVWFPPASNSLEGFLVGNGVEGVIVVGSHPAQFGVEQAAQIGKRVPVVGVNAYGNLPLLFTVRADARQAFRQATQHLLQTGRKRIVLLSLRSISSPCGYSMFFMAGLAFLLALGDPAPAGAAEDETAVLPPLHFESPVERRIRTSLEETSDPVTGEETDVLRVSSPGMDGSFIIPMGSLPADPNRTYEARYFVRPDSLNAPANLYLQIRERPAGGGAPLNPYPREGVRQREVPVAMEGEWIERSLIFHTQAETGTVEVRLVVPSLDGELSVSELQLKPVQEAVEISEIDEDGDLEEFLADLRAAAGERVPLTPRPLVFSRSQLKYWLSNNYSHQWVDRPLYINRDLGTYESVQRMLEKIPRYDIDGIAFFPQSFRRMRYFDLAERAVEESNLKEVMLLPEFLAGQDLASYEEVLERALASPLTPRIDGRVLITSYAAAGNTPAEWEEILESLRARYGDSFLFLPALSSGVGLRSPYRAGDYAGFRRELEEVRARLRSYLEVCDGIYFNYPAALRELQVFPRPFDRDFYEGVFIPAWQELLTDPEYQDKYFGLSAYRAHLMPERGNNLYEDGTRTLRYSFEPAMEARPDVIILPEWDEQNENTSWRPTLYGSTTSQRILRYYMSRLRDKPPSAVPGDDESIPNLILSLRKMLALGENATMELLNVPDTDQPGSYEVELRLQDQAGRELLRFDPVVFEQNELQEARFFVATEEFPEATALIPVLSIRGFRGNNLDIEEGLPHAKVRGTWNWNHLYQKLPLRELLRPERVRFTLGATPDERGFYPVEAEVVSREELALVEVVADDDTVYAHDVWDEFFRDDPGRMLVLIDFRSMHGVRMNGTVSLEGVRADFVRDSLQVEEMATREAGVQVLNVSVHASPHDRWLYLALSNEGEGRLVFDFPDAEFTVDLEELREQRMIAHAGDQNGLHITVWDYHKQINHPRHIGARRSAFQAGVRPERPDQQFHLRLTSQSGKMYRSKPLQLPETSADSETVVVWSDAREEPVQLRIAQDRVPEIRYEFEPDRGAVLISDAGQPFYATAGGFVASVTGRGVMTGMHEQGHPQRTAPRWEEIDGQPALCFDGRGMYLKLPLETLPRRSGFTLEMEIQPTGGDDYLLLMNRIHGRQKGLGLEVRQGRLVGSFRCADWRVESFPTDLRVPHGEWSRIRVVYDYDQIRFEVDGVSESFELSQPGTNNGYTLIGDDWDGNRTPFEGCLRNLLILHHPNPR